MRTRLLCFTISLAVTTVLVGACGSSDSKDTPDSKGTGGKSSMTTTDAGSGLPCGSNICKGTETADPCCIDKFAGTCGYKNGTQCTEKAPPPPSDCPKLSAAMGYTLNGCCTADNKCGLDLSQMIGTSASCVELSEAKAGFERFQADAGLNFGTITFPEPQACP